MRLCRLFFFVCINPQIGCWGSFVDGAPFRGEEPTLAVDARKTAVTHVEFRQTGYVVSLVSPIATPAVLRSAAGNREIAIPAGESRFCVSGARYELELAGCFRTAAGIEVLSRDRPAVNLTPAVFAVEGSIEGEDLAGNGVDAKTEDKNGETGEIRETGETGETALEGNRLRADAPILVRAVRETAVLAETVAQKTGNSFHYRLVGSTFPRFP